MDKTKLPMRIGVGIIVLNNQNQVFVGKRKDNPIDKWQMPQGGININETPYNAMKRELEEELFNVRTIPLRSPSIIVVS